MYVWDTQTKCPETKQPGKMSFLGQNVLGTKRPRSQNI
jgi:hypothetical protein